MVVNVYPDRDGLVVDGAQVWVSQLREWVGAICLHLQYLYNNLSHEIEHEVRLYTHMTRG